ncbi:hypothetical protein SCHPADRAFT_914261 [Schizopora paradoxa]|uniref:STEEP1 domain-containing protein n=1 Tax=Schizopora paradoxa TaxID=27342 RepID=A0A0H2SFL2_9AGAM|nr:hypothetical protein SCHPADRAFT_914261 [Schizopora paradoxa]
MSKRVSRSTVSSSTEAKPTASSTTALHVYYCICGEFILVIDKPLSSLPRRKTDNAIIVRSQDSNDAKSCIFKLNSSTPKDTEAVLIDRPEGLEKQYRFQCPRCSLVVAYQSFPPPAKAAPFLYVLHGALTQQQGQVPSDAFDVHWDGLVEGSSTDGPNP